jgi:uncharacterized membrane protein YadS
MRAQRAIASVVLVALLGVLGLPWIGETHQFNDDPHWAVAYGADHGSGPVLGTGQPGDEAHCEVCHWLRTMRTAARPAQVTLFRDVRLVVPPATSDPRTRAASPRVLSARAPPTNL